MITHIKTVITKHRLELNELDLIDVLNGTAKSFVDLISRDARITVHVPGDGGWSNKDLSIDDHSPIVIEWETRE